MHLLIVDRAGDLPSGVDGFEKGGLRCDPDDFELPARQGGTMDPGGMGLGHPGVAPVEMLIYERLAELPAGHPAGGRTGRHRERMVQPYTLNEVIRG